MRRTLFAPTLFLVVVFVLSVLSPSRALADNREERKLYIGHNSSEAIMTFRYQVEFGKKKPTGEFALRKIEEQLAHLFGPMSVSRYKAVPKGDHEISSLKISRRDDGIYVASYRYRGTVVLMNGPTTTYSIILPRNPDTIYTVGLLSNGSKPCTDWHYNEEGDFWYFWNPQNDDCPLREGVHYDQIRTSIERLENTRQTYPDYPRLVHLGKTEIHILLGMDHESDEAQERNPLTSNDINAVTYRGIREGLQKIGFAGRQWSPGEITDLIDRNQSVRDLPFVEEFVKKDERTEIVVRLFFGPSGIDEKSRNFHYFLKDAIANAAVMVYSGHSGLGGHLDIESIEATEGFSIPFPNRYQIYYFNSCSSYPYYNTMYFARKATRSDPRGSWNLDIMTNGLATYFSLFTFTDLTIVKAIDAWASGTTTLSYQKLVPEMDSGNLFGINGDEDNPTEPPIARK